MYKKCVVCKKVLPEYLVGSYPLVFQNPVCPVCALRITNKLLRKPPGTPFKKDSDQEALLEAKTFFTVQNKHNRGGHMINPPEECPFRFVQRDKGEWVDLGNCNRTCKDQCIRFYQWKRMGADERKDELFDNGILNA